MLEDPIGAFVPGGPVTVDGVAGGPLAGLTFAAKDNFDVAGLAKNTPRPAATVAPSPSKTP